MTDKKESAEERKKNWQQNMMLVKFRCCQDSKRFASAQGCTSAQLAVRDCII
ncbi:hypothetical protein AAULR_00030 [Lacticaseibacillus rhamnosus MTCC 5462]|nr:hypothetical protein AAULR_00030 [Lacticaseibacillus rhamnosus MTCC 5462]